MQATFNFEFGDLADVMAGKPRTAAPLASSERSRKTRREVYGVVMGGGRGRIVVRRGIFQSEHQVLDFMEVLIANFLQESIDADFCVDEFLDGVDLLLVTRKCFDGHGVDSTGHGVAV